jgi:ribosomal protein S18 acetylase RimI-like enzyme
MSPQMNDGLRILRATRTDLSLATAAVAQVHQRLPLDESALAVFLDDRSNILLLAMRGERVVGSLIGHSLRRPHDRAPQFLLYEIDVLPEHRQSGIGKALVEGFVDKANAAGANEVWVLTNRSNVAAMSMYRACGFDPEHQDDVMMRRILSSKGPV